MLFEVAIDWLDMNIAHCVIAMRTFVQYAFQDAELNASIVCDRPESF
jgi:hypothetical protein